MIIYLLNLKNIILIFNIKLCFIYILQHLNIVYINLVN